MEPLEKLGERAGWGTKSDFNARFEAEDELEWAMAQLSRQERAVVTLRDLEGLAGEETAEALGLTLAAMRGYFVEPTVDSDVRARLASRMEAFWASESDHK